MAAQDLQNTLITVNVALSGIPVSEAGFGTVMFVSPDAAPSLGLVLTYQSATASADLAADLTANKITAYIKSAVEAAFSQNPRPSTVKVGKVPAFGDPSTLDVDMAAIVAKDGDFYGVALDLNGETIASKETQINKLAAWCETQNRLFLAMSHDPDVYGVSSTDIASDLKGFAYENTAFLWSQLVGATPGTADQPADVASLARWLAFDPNLQSAPFRAQVRGVTRAKYTADGSELAATSIAAAQGKNASLLLLYGSAAAFLDAGKNAAGRAWEEVLSKHWLQARVREDMASKVVDLANRGRKFPLTQEGLAIAKGIIARRLQQGVSAGHFSDYSIGAGSINTTQAKLIIDARATVLDNAREVTFSVDCE
jgi:hypothetical protein